MRPTDLQFRSPKERTPEFYYSAVTKPLKIDDLRFLKKVICWISVREWVENKALLH
jgi:hypothetical protein